MSVLINCAGMMRKIDLQKASLNLEHVTREIETNLNGTIWMDLQFLPHLKRQANAAIVSVSSGLAFVPMPISPVYSASKAACSQAQEPVERLMSKQRPSLLASSGARYFFA